MTNKKTFMNNKIKSICILVIVAVLSLVSCLFVACGKSSTYNESTQTFEWTDSSIIVNGSFEYGTEVDISEYPVTSPSSWSKAVDSNAYSSSVDSGIVSTKADAWKAYLENLYDDSDFLSYMEDKYDFDVSTIKSENSTLTDDEIKDKVVTDYFVPNFTNPSTHVDAEGSKIYALNNFKSGYGIGTAQKLTSSTAVTLEKGSFAVISVYVKTFNLEYTKTDANLYGANIRLENTVSNATQAQFRIDGIDTEKLSQTYPEICDANGWVKYSIYVKSDDFFDNTVKVICGLGYGDFASNYTQGCAYFDDITIEYLEADGGLTAEQRFNNITISKGLKTLDYRTSTKNTVDCYATNGQTSFCYTMNSNDCLNEYASSLLSKLDNPTDYGFYFDTDSNKTGYGYAQDKQNADISLINNNGICKYSNADKIIEANPDYSSYSIKFGSKASPIATLNPEENALIVFYVKAELSEFYKNGITIRVYDILNNSKEELRGTYTPTLDEDNGWTRVSFMVRNNFPEKDVDNEYTENVRSFRFEVIIGATDLSSALTRDSFAKGNILISIPEIAYSKNYIYQRYNYNGTYNTYEEALSADGVVSSYLVKTEITENIIDNYYYYLMLNYVVDDDQQYALYTGLTSDYSEDSNSDSYTFSTSQSAIGAILSNPANVEDFIGVDPDNLALNTEINTRSGEGLTQGNAGLINTKYIDSYKYATEIKNALNYTGEDSIQPLMIYNITKGAYGYIGQGQNITADSLTTISLRVRVVDDAVAYIYLVDTTNIVKDVLSITVPVNTNGTNYYTDAQKTQNTTTRQFVLTITSDMMEEDGWLDVSFNIATGNQAKSYRLELWNGARDCNDTNVNEKGSDGFVFFDNVSYSGTFEEPSTTNYLEAFNSGILQDAKSEMSAKGLTLNEIDKLLYRRELDANEIKYNADSSKTGSEVIYYAKYVFVKTDSMIYAIFNTLEADSVDPYENETTEDEESGCSVSTDSSTFWLSLSSVLMGLSLVFAIVALIIKNQHSKNAHNKNDAVVHYDVKSRNRIKKSAKVEAEIETAPVGPIEEPIEEPVEEVVETTETETEAEAPQEEKDSYVYGDVQDFGEDDKK